jgi:hypothetical protein
MEFIAIEAFRTAMQNPAFAENLNRRRSSSIEDTNGLPPSGSKIGNLLRRMSLSRSTSSSASATPVASPLSSQPNTPRGSSSTFPYAPVIAIPVMTVVDTWPISPIPPAIYYPPLPSDNISSSQHTEMLSSCDSPVNPLHENDHHEHTSIEQRLYH